MNKKITVIYGDGVGFEVTQQSVKVLEAVAEVFGHQFIFNQALLGSEAITATGSALPNATIEQALESDAVLFGAEALPKFETSHHSKDKQEPAIFGLRKALQLYAQVRPVKPNPGLSHLSPIKAKLLEKVDFLIVRELLGGLYSNHKITSDDGSTATDFCEYNKADISRITRLAFKEAQKRRKKLTLVDKADVLETSKLWRKVVQQTAKEFKDVEVTYLFADQAATQIVLNPAQFDVILTESLLGDILGQLASVLNGPAGMSPFASYGDSIGLFAPVHGAMPQMAGKDIANPIGAILSATLMLEYFGLLEEAQAVRAAIKWTQSGGFVAKEIDPINYYYTSTIGDLICDYIYGKVPDSVNKNNIEIRKSTII